MKQKTALITGITGQDGAYLAELLLNEGYNVYGSYRRSSTANFWRLEELGIKEKINLVTMDLGDQFSLHRIIEQIKPDEIYNLAALSFVQTSFTQPLYSSEVNGLAVTRILDVIRLASPHSRFYQASTSEMFGKVQSVPQDEATAFYPRSPYGVAKLYGHWITVNYREAYKLYACSGILFNHESPLRGAEFVTRKITAGLAAVKYGLQDCLELGNLDAKRDWGFAGDYVRGMWAMLQQGNAEDYVLATGKTHSIRTFAELAAHYADIDLVWEGAGIDEVGRDRKTGKICVKINPEFYRPSEVDILIGNPAKAREKLNWEPSITLAQLIEMMMKADLNRTKTRKAA